MTTQTLTRNQGLVLDVLSQSEAPLSAYTILDKLRDTPEGTLNLDVGALVEEVSRVQGEVEALEAQGADSGSTPASYIPKIIRNE